MTPLYRHHYRLPAYRRRVGLASHVPTLAGWLCLVVLSLLIGAAFALAV